eukprot:2628714-Prymnesium_polylepis.1
MCDTCDDCEGIMLMGRGIGCTRGSKCCCRCYSWDARTCSEIVITHKRAYPDLDVTEIAAMPRNKILGFLFAKMPGKAMGNAYNINMATPGHDGPCRTDCAYVPMNIIQLTSRINRVVTFDYALEGSLERWGLEQPSGWKAVAQNMLKDNKPAPSIAKKLRKKACRTQA